MTLFWLGLAWVVLLAWVVFRVTEGCQHANVRGVANYYDHDLHCFVHLKQCEDCNEAIITTER